MLGNFRTKIKHKLDGLDLYCRAEKLRGYQLQVTGDIDEPLGISIHKGLLKEWIDLANHVGTVKPCLYVTASQPFEQSKELIGKISSEVDVGIHGLKHVCYSKLDVSELKTDLETEVHFSNKHRFPYLDWNSVTLQQASLYFDYDSSIVSQWMFPFKIGNMIEYPICSPTDTALRNKPINIKVLQLYKQLIANAVSHDRPLTFLFHPNPWSVNLLRKLKTS